MSVKIIVSTILGLAEIVRDYKEVKAALANTDAVNLIPAVAAAVSAPAVPEYRDLTGSETIAAGDEWKLRDGLSHSRGSGKLVVWRTVEGSVGQLVSTYPNSVFRRKI
jgi:hypothetical protein